LPERDPQLVARSRVPGASELIVVEEEVLMGPVTRWLARGGALLALATTVAACSVTKPPGDGVVRYRDPITQDVKVTGGITYSTSQDGVANDLKLDLYEPRTDTVAKRPAFIWIHGGGFVGGSRASSDMARYFASLGYVAVSIDYRLLPAGTRGCGGTGDQRPECVQAATNAQHDAQAVVRWLRAKATTYGIDPARVAMGGSSAGAVTSLLVATNSQDPGNSGNPGPSSKVGGVVSAAGGLPTNDTIDSGDAAPLMVNGTLDTTVPFAWAESNNAAFLAAHVPAVFEPQEGVGHNVITVRRDLIQQQGAWFLWWMMDLKNAQQ